jgi:MraZ protein
MDLLTGEYNNTLDDKGRISIPAKLRERLAGNTLVLTKGNESCVWLITPEDWPRVAENLMRSSTLSMKKLDLIQRRFIAPKVEVEFDKLGRVAVPQSLRIHAKLNRDCIILGTGRSLEIWDAGEYQAYLNSNEETLRDVLEELGPIDLYS